MDPHQIDLGFIEKWEKVYDCHENDEAEYRILIETIATELERHHEIKKETFIRLINWKSSRLRGLIKLNEYETKYQPVLSNLEVVRESRSMINSLVSLYGIGVPFASTILHFLHPDIFPIIDIRTTESLAYFGLWDNKSINEVNYLSFCGIIKNIRKKSGSTFRKIDRALFSFHKIYLMGKTKPNYIKQRTASRLKTPAKQKPSEFNSGILALENYIYTAYKMTPDEFASYLAGKYISDIRQKETFLRKGVWLKVRLNYIAALIMTSHGKKIFSPKEIRETVIKEILPSISSLDDQTLSGIILTQDVHNKAKILYNSGYYCLEKVSRGAYKFLGFK